MNSKRQTTPKGGESLETNINENNQTKLKYPKSVFFIFSTVICERFSLHSLKTILVMYLVHLGYSEDLSTMVFHIFIMTCYFTPLIGGIIADSFWGKYKTVLYLSLIYASGYTVLTVGSVKIWNIDHEVCSMIGLFLIGVGTGVIKPCVSSFGGDQFVVPQQNKELQQYFAIFYFTINGGAIIASLTAPLLRERVSCFGEDICYPLAFGTSTFFMCLAIAIFVCGRPLYKIQPLLRGNVMLKLVKCWSHAIWRKWKIQKREKKGHWVDYADDRFGLDFIAETKIILWMVGLFSTLIVFWALFHQLGSRWTLQATHMDGDVGFYVLQPDQMHSANCIFCLAFIPLFDSVLYPLLNKIKLLRTPLQKVGCGGILGAIAFLISGLLQMKIETSYPVLPASGMAHLRLYNTLNCSIYTESTQLGIKGEITRFDSTIFPNLPVELDFNLNTKFGNGCMDLNKSFNIQLSQNKISSYVFTRGEEVSLQPLDTTDSNAIEKSKYGTSKIQAIHGGKDKLDVQLKSNDLEWENLNITNYKSKLKNVKSNLWYNVIINGKSSGNRVYLESGGVYSLLITDIDKVSSNLLTITEPNGVNMLWQLPQYVLMSFGEVMVSIPGIEFAFTQSPLSMKSISSSLWSLSTSLGNLFVLFIAGFNTFDSQANEFFLFSALMALSMTCFMLMARKYKYVEINSDENETSDNDTMVSKL